MPPSSDLSATVRSSSGDTFTLNELLTHLLSDFSLTESGLPLRSCLSVSFLDDAAQVEAVE